jgi:hypothetical protein
MDPALAEIIGPVFALTAMGTFILIGIRMRFNHKYRMLNRESPEQVERLTDAVQQLHEEVRVLRDEMVELHERVDFAERMLTSGKNEGQ